MNILSLSPLAVLKTNNTPVYGNNNRKYCSPLAPLTRDTVTFSGSKLIHAAFESNYNSQLPMFKDMGRKLMATMEEVAHEVEGCIYDKEYCVKSLNKNTKRYMKKFQDSGTVPMDKIRTTVFIKNLYDLSITANLLKALEKRNYYVLPLPDKASGKKVFSWKPDFDIRLDDVSPSEIKKLPSNLRECLSHRQKSGYGDIQMRVVDASDIPVKDRNEKTLSKLTPQEIILVFGKNTANSKTDESKYVFNITRALDKLNLLEYGQEGVTIHKVKNHIKTIGSILRSNISKPLYRNAENLDVYPEGVVLEPVALKKDHCSILTGYISDLKALVSKYYSTEKKRICSSEFDIELEKMIKSTPEYKSRANKRVSDEEINLKRDELLRRLKEHRKEDAETISEQISAMEETIKKYGPSGSVNDKKS